MPAAVKKSDLKDYSRYPFRNFSLEDMKGEVWEDIPELDGYFKVSNYGRIWGLERPVFSVTGQFYTIKERMRKQNLVRTYNSFAKIHTEQLSIRLRYNGEKYGYLVNRLVYHTFINPIDFETDGLLVVHKDGDNCNNNADNLILMNGTELYGHGLNIDRRARAGTTTVQNPKKLVWNESNYPKAIVQYSLDGKKTNEYESVAEAAAANQSARSNIRSIVSGKLKQLNGFVYRYKGDRYRGEHADFSWVTPVVQYSIEGKKMKTYPSITDAAMHTGIDGNSISKCALGEHRFASGYVWRYPGKKYSGEYQGTIKNQAKAIIQYSLEGKKIAEYGSVLQAASAVDGSPATLLDCANKVSRVSHGFVWRYEGDPYHGEYKGYRIGRPVSQFTRENKRIGTYETLEAAARATGLTPSNINKNVTGHNATAGGFVWRYATEKEIETLPAFEQPKYVTTTGIREIIQYSLEGKKLKTFNTIREAAAACQIAGNRISQSLDKPKTSAGFVWRSKGNSYKGELAKSLSASKARMVTQYDLEGKKVFVFKSMRDAERITGISGSTISAVTRGKLRKTGGFIWRLGDGDEEIDMSYYHNSIHENLRKISRPVEKYSLDGTFIAEFPSIAEAARSEGVSVNAISATVNKAQKSALGFLWKFKGNVK